MTVYPPVEEQPDLEIMVEVGMLIDMMVADGYRLWVTDSVVPSLADNAPPDAEVFWYWAQGKTYANSHLVCQVDDIMEAVGRQLGLDFAMLLRMAPATNLTVKIPRTISPRETAIFMRWIDPATVGGKE